VPLLSGKVILHKNLSPALLPKTASPAILVHVRANNRRTKEKKKT
jgi:hypothetical protein